MNVLDAAYCLGKDYPGGAEALSLRTGNKNLSDELNPNRKGAKLGLQSAVDIEVLSGDHRILLAHALTLRYFPPIPMPEESQDRPPCLRTLGDLAQEFGHLTAEVVKDLADNKLNDLERKRIGRAWLHLLQTGETLMRQLDQKNAELHRGAA